MMSDRREPSVNRPRAGGARAALLLFLFACLALAGRPHVHSDGAVYYAVSESLAADGDFDLANQRDLTDIEWRAVADFRSHGGRLASIYSGGIALLNLPFLWPTLRLHDEAGFLKGLDALGASLDGIPLAFSVAILSASFVYLCLAALLTFEVVRRWGWSCARRPGGAAVFANLRCGVVWWRPSRWGCGTCGATAATGRGRGSSSSRSRSWRWGWRRWSLA